MDELVPGVVRGFFTVGILGSAGRGRMMGQICFLLFFKQGYGGESNIFNPSQRPVV